VAGGQRLIDEFENSISTNFIYVDVVLGMDRFVDISAINWWQFRSFITDDSVAMGKKLR
jgi:hypothetical protein